MKPLAVGCNAGPSPVPDRRWTATILDADPPAQAGKIARRMTAFPLCRAPDRAVRDLAVWRFFAFLRDVLREAGFLSTAKSASFAPAFNFSRSQTGCAPLPAHVFPELSRYLTATFRPLNKLGRPLFLSPPPSRESCSLNSTALRLRASSISPRSCKRSSTDIEVRLRLAIGTSEKTKVTHPTPKNKTYFDCERYAACCSLLR